MTEPTADTLRSSTRPVRPELAALLRGLKPTAGYPGDAARFFEAIRPCCERLGLPEAAVWRRK